MFFKSKFLFFLGQYNSNHSRYSLFRIFQTFHLHQFCIYLTIYFKKLFPIVIALLSRLSLFVLGTVLINLPTSFRLTTQLAIISPDSNQLAALGLRPGLKLLRGGNECVMPPSIVTSLHC